MDQAPIQEINIHDALNDTLIIMANKLERGITIQREFASDLPTIEAWGSELNQVWTNLIDNAADAMDEDGTLVLTTKFDDDWITVQVIDDGPGIPEDIQSRVFDPFFTTKPPGSGAGLGLHSTNNIVVQRHNGRIELESQSGRTVFEVRLPRAHVSARADSSRASNN